MKKHIISNILILIGPSVLYALVLYLGNSLHIKNEKICYLTNQIASQNSHTQQDSLNLTPQNVLYWCGELDIKFDTIVVAQSILETGWYSSDKCLIDNNIFGLQHSEELSFTYGHWLGSLVRYKLFQDNYYTGGDYYEFLDSCGYAEDSLYTEKLKVIVKQLKWEL